MIFFPDTYVHDLYEAMAVVQNRYFDDLETHWAAFEVLTSFGYCHLYGVGVPEYLRRAIHRDFAQLHELAHSELMRYAEHTATCVSRAPAQFDNSDADEDVAVVTGLLHLRQKLHAAMTTLTRHADQAVPELLAEATTAVHKIDSVLQTEEYLKLLSVTLATNLIENWRAMMQDCPDGLPWWLDGCIEAASRAVDDEIETG